MPKAAETVRQYAGQAEEGRRGGPRMSLRLQAGQRYEQGQETIRQHPVETIAVALTAVGVGVGLLIGFALRSPQSTLQSSRNRMVAEGIGRRLLERAECMFPEQNL